MEGRIAAAEKQQRDAEAANKRAQERLSSLEDEREKLVQDAKTKAKSILDNARAASEMALEEARKVKQEASDGKDVNLAAARAILRGTLSEAEKEAASQRAERKAMPLPRPLRAGDSVEIVSTRTKATVLETPKPGEKVKVQAGILKIQVEHSDLQLLEFEQVKQEAPRSGGVRLKAPEQFTTELDLRGESGDEAIMELDRFLDSAVRLHMETVRIIHGKGTGVLRQRVQTHLKRHPQVKSFRLGVYGEGEDGVTIASLKK